MVGTSSQGGAVRLLLGLLGFTTFKVRAWQQAVKRTGWEGAPVVHWALGACPGLRGDGSQEDGNEPHPSVSRVYLAASPEPLVERGEGGQLSSICMLAACLQGVPCLWDRGAASEPAARCTC